MGATHPQGMDIGVPHGGTQETRDTPQRNVGTKNMTQDVFRTDPHRRRIDGVHLSHHILPTATRCYTHFLANSDHKAVTVHISPPISSSF